MNTPILITGHPRSGAGIFAGVLKICGASMGNLDVMYENYLIREEWMKLLLIEIGMNEDGYDCKGDFPLSYPKGIYVNKLRTLLECQEMSEGVWAYKDNRITPAWKVFMSIYPKATFIVVRRADNDILKSCEHTAYMNHFNNKRNQEQMGVGSPREGWKKLLAQYKLNWEAMKGSGVNYIEVWPSMMCGDLFRLRLLIKDLGLIWKDDEVKNYLCLKIKK